MFKTIKIPSGGDAAIALLLVAVVALMILPLPPAMIDTLLSLNICASITLLMTTLYARGLTTLSSFPSLLLFTTLYRLSLNIASTKSILLHAEAGAIIESFGKLVVGGNLVVGLVVFAIITIVQFIVIAKGSERVAEVSARFTLDGLPGKQMSIDADLRSNLLTPEEARYKRAHLALETSLHGGMDGAMKFVKGDAIAGLLITVVTIVAGIAVGVLYHGMTAGESARHFAILSIGDAMVSQIASLIISVAAGIMITRVSDDSQPTPATTHSMGEEILRQIFSDARALAFAAVLVCGFAAVPGFPWPLFLGLGAVLGLTSYRIAWRNKRHPVASAAHSPLQRAGARGVEPPIRSEAPQFASPVGVKLSPDLARTLSRERLDGAFQHRRRALQEELGLPFPGITMWSSATLPDLTCQILLQDVPVSTVTLTEGPAEEVIAAETIDILRKSAAIFVGIQETQWVLDQLNVDYPGLVIEVQKALSVQRIAEVLRRLLEEDISIRNARGIMESLVTWGPKEKDLLMLTEYVRCDMARYIAWRATSGASSLAAVLLDGELEQHIRQSIKQTPTGNFLALPPEEIDVLVQRIGTLLQNDGGRPVEGAALVASMDIRRYLRRMIELRLKWLPVYSYQELGGLVELRPLGRVGM